MKKLPFFLFLVVLAVVPAIAQQKTGRLADEYEFGSVVIRVPAPEGFVNTFGRLPKFEARLAETGPPRVTTLALHVPGAIIPDLEKNPNIGLKFYTKLGVSTAIRATDYSPERFKALVSGLEKQLGTLLDVKGPAVREMADRIRTGLDKSSSAESGFDYDQAKNLGFFQKGENVFSSMTAFRATAFGKEIPMISTVTSLRLRNRLIMLSTYSRFEKESDIEALRDFTEKWTAAVIAANK